PYEVRRWRPGDRMRPVRLRGRSRKLSDLFADLRVPRDHRQSALAAHPFYVQCHPYAVHSPTGNSQCRPDLLSKYGSVPDGVNHTVDPLAGILENMDQTMGRILDYLDDPNRDGDTSDSIATNTVVLFTSDNGGHIGPTDNDPLRHRKGSFWEGGIRVPLIVSWPGVTAAGTRSDTYVHAVDFYPTFVELAQTNLPAGLTFDGTSFAAHLAGTPRDREPIYYHFPGYLDRRARPVDVIIKRAACGEDFKLIYNYDMVYTGNPANSEDVGEGLKDISANGPWELYNLSRDLSETDNLLDGSHANWLLYGELAQTMATELVAWLNQPGADWEAKKLTLDGTATEVPFPDPMLMPVSPQQRFGVADFRVDPTGDELMFTWNSEAGFRYDIESSSDLETWSDLKTNIVATGTNTSD
ncbi:MAG: tRNA lysidine(34) synthetase TilS, partial [Verrucomicrobiota bacterium]